MLHFIPLGITRRLVPMALVTGLATAVLSGHAQSAAHTRPDPLDPKANVPALTYQSSFLQYRSLDEVKPVSWRDANDTVARIGGWRVYAREARQPDAASTAGPAGTDSVARPGGPASSPVPGETDKPQPAGHGGHKTP